MTSAAPGLHPCRLVTPRSPRVVALEVLKPPITESGGVLAVLSAYASFVGWFVASVWMAGGVNGREGGYWRIGMG